MTSFFCRRNILPEMTDSYLKSCHRRNDSLCPIFRLGDVVQEAGEKFPEMAIEVGSPGFYLLYIWHLPLFWGGVAPLFKTIWIQVVQLYCLWSFYSFSCVDHRGASSASRSNGTATWTHSCGAASPNTPLDGWMRRRATRRCIPASTSGVWRSEVRFTISTYWYFLLWLLWLLRLSKDNALCWYWKLRVSKISVLWCKSVSLQIYSRHPSWAK